MLECDVLIVGAGPAGASLAYFLSEKKIKIVLIERKSKIEYPVRCAELVPVNFAGLFDFKICGINNQIDYMDTLVCEQSEYKKVDLSSIKKVSAPSFILDRDVFVKDVVAKFIKNGGIFFNRAKIQKLNYLNVFERLTERKFNETFLKDLKSLNATVDVLINVDGFKKEIINIKTKVIVGADGCLSSIGRLINSKNKNFMAGMQWRIKMSEIPDSKKKYIKRNNKNDDTNISDKKTASFFFSPYIKNGYGWVFPKNNCLNIGVGVDISLVKKLKNIFEFFIKDVLYVGLYKTRMTDSLYSDVVSGRCHTDGYDGFYENIYKIDDKKIYDDIEIIDKITGLIPISGIVKKPVLANFILIGDAAGLCNPITGAGIYNAVFSAKLASDVISESIKCNNLNILHKISKSFSKEFSQSLNRAQKKKVYQIRHWPEVKNDYEGELFKNIIKKTWPIFKEYYS